jgi:hypothetical protein
MGLNVQKTTVNYGVQIWQTGRSPETAQGGFILDTTGLTAGDTLKGGTAMTYDETTRIAKKATVTAGVDDAPDTSDAKGLLYEDVVIGANQDVCIGVRGTIYENRIPAVDDAHKAALKGLIIFSQSY